MARRLALIDADEIAYKGAFACQDSYYVVKDGDKILWKCKNKTDAIESMQNFDWEIEKVAVPLDPKIGYARIDNIISQTLYNSKSHSARFFLSGSKNFRKELAKLTPYKANRSEKPVNLPLMVEYFQYKGAETTDYLEADDLLSAYQGNVDGWETIICTQDKDLRTVPGLNYNPNTKKVTDISVMEARKNFYYQILIGDPTDSIPHPTGLGPKYASKIVDSLYERGEDEVVWYDEVVEAYTFHLYKGREVAHPSSPEEPNEFIWKTSWYDGQDIHEVIWEVANLLHMHRTTLETERWTRPQETL